jgi:hypothetical protein
MLFTVKMCQTEVLWSIPPEDIGLILTRFVEKAKLPGVPEAQSLRVSFALTAVTGLNDFVGGIIIDSYSRFTFSSSMASHLGTLFEALLMSFTTEGMFDVLYTIHHRLSALKCSENSRNGRRQ